MVEAWAEEYIRFERRPVEQEQLRAEIRTRLGQLAAAPDQVLHTTFFGAKHPAADVENLALYNIDDTGASFANAARYGLRFELATDCPPSPTGRDYAYGYRYELLRRDTACRHWRDERELASWDRVDLGAFAGPKKLEQVWLALQRHQVDVTGTPRASSTPFAVRVAIRPPQGVVPRSVTWSRESSTASSARSRPTPTGRASLKSPRGSRTPSRRHPMRSRRSWCGKTRRCSASSVPTTQARRGSDLGTLG